MSEIIQEWLSYDLGVIYEPGKWNNDVGGILLSRILNFYDLISTEQMISIQKHDKDYQFTLEYIRSVVNNLGISLSKEEFADVINAKQTANTKLLYELFLALKDKDIAYFTANKKANKFDIKAQKGRNYEIEKVDEMPNTIRKFGNPLSEPILSNSDILEWSRAKFNIFLEKCKNSRKAYEHYMEKKKLETSGPTLPKVPYEFHQKVDETLPIDAASIDLNIEELLAEETKAKLLDCHCPDASVANKIIKNIKKKRRKFAARNELRIYFQKMLMKDLWDKLIANQESYFKSELTNKMLKQSQYEQQMVTKMYEVRQQRDQMAANKMEMMIKVSEEESKRFINELLYEQNKENAERLRYYTEREKKMELHQRLYAEKLRRRAEDHYNICMQVMEDLTDIAVYNATYREMFDEELSRRARNDVASLFVKELPIFDVLNNAVDVIDYEPDTLEEDLEDMCLLELSRQNAQDEMSFEAYCNYLWPWELSLVPDVDVQSMELGMNVIGYIVHRLLLSKYPKIPPPPPVVLPKVSVATCINGLDNLMYLPALARLLQARKIKVIEVQDVINYCLKAFKDETAEEYLSTVLVEETKEALENIAKKKAGKKEKKSKKNKTEKKGKKKKTGKAKKVKDRITVSILQGDENKFEDKEVQTPRLFPSEEPILSSAAELGRMAFTVLNLGDSPNELLIASMFVQYLKSLQDIEGWVLINYPQTIQQATALEEALTSIPVPAVSEKLIEVDSINDITDLDERNKAEINPNKDVYADNRFSKLIKNPKPIEIPYYDTYLTAYIELKSFEGDDLNQEYYDIFKSIQNNNYLNKFYEDQGCKYTLHYKNIDFPTIKHLGKLILGEYTIPPKDSVELFTDTVKYVEAEWDELTAPPVIKVDHEGIKKKRPKSKEKKSDKNSKSDNNSAKKKIKKDSKKSSSKKSSSKKSTTKKDSSKKRNSKKGSSKKSSKGSKKGKKGKGKKKKSKVSVIIVHEDKETQIPEPPEEEEEVKNEPERIPLPGEPDWIYVNLSIPDFFENALATLWENMESIYIIDFQQLFFRRRILLNPLIPYKLYLRKIMHEFISRPDNKQTHLHLFQKIYNDFDDDMREDDEVKAELHYKIYEFQCKLWNICDERMHESEQERQRIIEENWLLNLIYELTNIFVTFMQLEIDRCSDTMQMLTDYYFGMVTKMPYDQRPLEKYHLNTIQLPIENDSNLHLTVHTNYIQNLLKDADNTSFQYSTFHKVIESHATDCLSYITNYFEFTEKALSNINNIFKPKTKKGKEKKATSKSSGSRKSKDKSMPKCIEPEQEIKDRAADIAEEFSAAIKGESIRAKLRIELLKKVAFEEIEDVLGSTTKTFHNLFYDIQNRYYREISSVNKACEVFLRAVEAESKIQPELVLAGDEFIIKLENLMFEGPLSETLEPVIERDDENFTLAQLHTLVNILMLISPSGQVPERVFVFVFQDILIHNPEDGKCALVPPLWINLHPHKTHKLCQELFGDSEYIDWKDFIAYNLGIPFPSEEALMLTRNQFKALDPDNTEIIYEYQIAEIEFWFEKFFDNNDPVHTLKLTLIRSLLVKLYKIDESRINYTALLLLFCKDENPVLGLVKALELSCGRFICWENYTGTAYYEAMVARKLKFEMQKLAEEVERKENLLMVEEILTRVIDSTVHKCASVELLDITSRSSFFGSLVDNVTNINESQSIDDEQYREETPNISEFEQSNSSMFLFRNASQGFESSDGKEHILNFDTLINVLTVVLPWHSKLQNFDDKSFRERVALIYECDICADFKCVFAHTFLNNPHFVELIKQIYKFQAKHPVDIIKRLINN